MIESVLKELRLRLAAHYGDRLRALILYGSHSRREATPDSDIDVLVVLAGEPSASQEVIATSSIISELSLAHDVVLSCMFVAEQEYRRSGSPLLMNVRKEGIAV